MLVISCSGVPPQTIPALAEILERHGAKIFFTSPTSGTIDHISGKIIFQHKDDTLVLAIEHNAGHFPTRLLIGGIRQLVQETVELLSRKPAAC